MVEVQDAGRGGPDRCPAGWASFHGATLARRVPGARLVAVADPAPGAAERLAGELGATRGLSPTRPARWPTRRSRPW